MQDPSTTEAPSFPQSEHHGLWCHPLCLVQSFRCTLDPIPSIPVFMVFLSNISPFGVNKKLLLWGDLHTLLEVAYSSREALRDGYSWTQWS